jgi:Ca2+-binding EF-hand superfamily protein
MRRLKPLHVLAVAAALLPGLAAAQVSGEKRQEAAKQVRDRFTTADANGDGQLSRDEAKAGMPRVFERFDEIDSAGKGFVTLEDLRTSFGQRLKNRRGAGS